MPKSSPKRFKGFLQDSSIDYFHEDFLPPSEREFRCFFHELPRHLDGLAAKDKPVMNFGVSELDDGSLTRLLHWAYLDRLASSLLFGEIAHLAVGLLALRYLVLCAMLGFCLVVLSGSGGASLTGRMLSSIAPVLPRNFLVLEAFRTHNSPGLCCRCVALPLDQSPW